MIIRFAEPEEYPDVLSFYKTCNYGGGVAADDILVIAVAEQIAGAVRISTEGGVKVLRGMQVKLPVQGRGIGSLMLKFLADHVDLQDCYCLPYSHLENFYAKIGFGRISRQDAPLFLIERLEGYLAKGDVDIIIMKISQLEN